jgi:hypothetical protein
LQISANGGVSLGIRKESPLALRNCQFGGEPPMTEIEVLDRDIQGLKQLLHLAWEDLATKSFTPYEYREKRNEMDRCAAELRERLKAIEAERQRARERVQDRRTLQAQKVSLRLLG